MDTCFDFEKDKIQKTKENTNFGKLVNFDTSFKNASKKKHKFSLAINNNL
jgi:hypothetical protein